MKTIYFYFSFLLFLSCSVSLAQKVYVNTGFEKTDSVGKSVLKWESVNRGVEFKLDSNNFYSGKNSLFVKCMHNENMSATFNMYLPKSFYQDLRSIQISFKVYMVSEQPYAGLWCKLKKDKELLGYGSSLKGTVPAFNYTAETPTGQNMPVIPMSWTSYSFEVNINKDPGEIIIGGFVKGGKAWFDDIQITINGKVITDLVIPIVFDEN